MDDTAVQTHRGSGSGATARSAHRRYAKIVLFFHHHLPNEDSSHSPNEEFRELSDLSSLLARTLSFPLLQIPASHTFCPTSTTSAIIAHASKIPSKPDQSVLHYY